MKYGIIPRPDKLDLAPRHKKIIKVFDTYEEAEKYKSSFYGGYADIEVLTTAMQREVTSPRY